MYIKHAFIEQLHQHCMGTTSSQSPLYATALTWDASRMVAMSAGCGGAGKELDTVASKRSA